MPPGRAIPKRRPVLPDAHPRPERRPRAAWHSCTSCATNAEAVLPPQRSGSGLQPMRA